MADETADDVKIWFEAASKGASLEFVLPASNSFSLPTIFRDGGADNPLLEIAARRNLFFDEQANVLVSLKTLVPEEHVRRLLPSLELKLSAHATDAVPEGSSTAASASGTHDLVSTSLGADRSAEICSTGGAVYVLWSTKLHLARPRVRLQRPAIYFTAYLTIRPVDSTVRSHDKSYLESYEPLSANVLEPLRSDPALVESEIYLSEARVTKVAPRTSQLRDIIKPIRGSSKRAYPVVPAILSRIRYSSMPDAIIASLHVETSRLVPGPVHIGNLAFDVDACRVHRLVDLEWPVQLQAGDELVMLYKVAVRDHSKRRSEMMQDDISSVSIAIDASVQLDDGSDTEVNVSWQTQANLSQTYRQSNYKWSRPLSSASSRPFRLSGSVYSQPPSSEVWQRNGDEYGTTFVFRSPPTVFENEAFKLTIQCNNRSHRSRRFAVIVMPNQRYRPPKQLRSSVTNTDMVIKTFGAGCPPETQPPDVLDMNADVRIGPLSPGASFETDMKFRAAATGILGLGTLRIIDLETRQTIDVRDLPNAVALKAAISER